MFHIDMIINQKLHNARWAQKISKSGHVFKIEHRNQIFLNSKYLRKSPLQNLTRKIYIMY